MRPPIDHEPEQRHYDRAQRDQQYSYDLTQRLTFFVIAAELIFCGYILLNAEKFGVINYAGELFLIAGLAALFGILWRFCYNQNYHDTAHSTVSKVNVRIHKVQAYSYWAYIALSLIFFVSLLVTGYNHLENIKNPQVEVVVVEQEKPIAPKEAPKEYQGIKNREEHKEQAVVPIANHKPEPQPNKTSNPTP